MAHRHTCSLSLLPSYFALDPRRTFDLADSLLRASAASAAPDLHAHGDRDYDQPDLSYPATHGDTHMDANADAPTIVYLDPYGNTIVYRNGALAFANTDETASHVDTNPVHDSVADADGKSDSAITGGARTRCAGDSARAVGG